MNWKSHTVGAGPSSDVAGVFLKRGDSERDTHAGRMSHVCESRDRGDAHTSQGKPEIASRPPGARGTDCDRMSLHPLGASPADSAISDSSLQDRETTHVCPLATLYVPLRSCSPSERCITPCPPDSFQSMARFHLVLLCLPIQARCGAGWG